MILHDRRELVVFAIVGTFTVMVDFITYRGLAEYKVVGVDMAKATGFLVGTLFSYVANRFWTFGQKLYRRGSAWRFSVLYASTLSANILINAVALKAINNTVVAFQLAFLLATGVSACLNFLGMKLFVFRAISKSELQ